MTFATFAAILKLHNFISILTKMLAKNPLFFLNSIRGLALYKALSTAVSL